MRTPASHARPRWPSPRHALLRNACRVLLACVVLFAGGVLGHDAIATVVPVPPLDARVTDLTQTLDADQRRALEAKLAAFESDKGAQVAVLIVPTTGDEAIERYSIRVVDAWKLGRMHVDDGILLLVAKDDRKVRIEVGRGFEGVIPDAIANRIIDGFMKPRFLAGDYAGGLDAGIDRIIGLANGGSLPVPPTQDTVPAPEASVADAPIPPMTAHVVDQTGLLTFAQTRSLDAKLAAFATSKGRQIAVLLVKDTGTDDAHRFSGRVFDAWNLGVDGVLIVKSQDPWDLRITVESGMADVLTHPVMRRILDEDMSWPNVKLGDTAGELNGGVDRIIALENGEPMPPPPKPEGYFARTSWLELFSPPPLRQWLTMFVGGIFLFLAVSCFLSWKSALVRGGSTSVAIGGLMLLLGAGPLFALCFAALAFYLAVLNKSDGPEPDWEPDPKHTSNVSSGSIAWSLLGGLAGSLISSGGGGGFRGGGGGFSGGGASGSW